MSQSGNTAGTIQSESAAASNNLYSPLNPLLLALNLAALSALLLLLFTSIADVVIAALSFLFGVIFGLFPGLRAFHQQPWFHGQLMTAFLSVILGIGSTFLFLYFTEVKPTTAETSNLLVNADFEQSIYMKRWDESDYAELKWDDGYKGSGLCIIQNATEEMSEPEWALIYQTIQVTPSQLYRFTGYMKWINATQAHLKVDWYTADDKWLGSDFFSPFFDGSSGGWTQQSKIVTAPADATKASIVAIHGVINGETNMTGGTLCVDEVTFEPFSTP